MLLVGLAIVLAIDPDYPLPAASSPSGSAGAGEVLLPQAIEPRGALASAPAAFRWERNGATGAWRLVVLDADLTTLFRGEPLTADRAPAPAALRGGDHYWLLERDAPPARTAPVWFRIAAPAAPR
jgi:hypothetical protein